MLSKSQRKQRLHQIPDALSQGMLTVSAELHKQLRPEQQYIFTDRRCQD